MKQFCLNLAFVSIASLFLAACGVGSVKTNQFGPSTALGEAANSGTTTLTNEQLLSKLKNASVVTIPDTNLRVTLSGEVTEFKDPHSELNGKVVIFPITTPVSTNDAATILAITKSDTPEKLYVAVFTPGETAWQETDKVELGSDALIRSLSTSASGIVTVAYLQHKPNQPITDKPTLPVTRFFSYQKGKLIELGKQL